MPKRKTFRTLMTLSFFGLSVFSAGATLALQGRASLTTPKSKDQTMTQTKDGATRESPFACNVAGISAERRPRYMALAKKLAGAKEEVRELPDGYAFRYSVDASTLQELAEFITYERLCCPFFDLEMAVEREGGPVWLRLRGREGVKEFIRAEFGLQ